MWRPVAIRASWRDVPMLLMTMQRLVAMGARDLSRYLVTHLLWLCPIRALATPNCRQMLSQLSQLIMAGNPALQPSVSASRALEQAVRGRQRDLWTFERPRAWASEASQEPWKPSPYR